MWIQLKDQTIGLNTEFMRTVELTTNVVRYYYRTDVVYEEEFSTDVEAAARFQSVMWVLQNQGAGR